MSTYVIGIKPPDDRWKHMKEIFDRCKELGEEAPQFVWDFFDGEAPQPDGVKVKIPHAEYDNSEHSEQGIDVHIDQLPEDVKIIRFINSW